MARKKGNPMGEKKSGEKVNKKKLTSLVLEFFAKNNSKTFNYKQIGAALMVKNAAERKLILEVLYDLVLDEYIEEISRGKFKLKASGSYIMGRVQLLKGGNAYVISDEIKEDVFVRFKHLKHALDRDLVRVYLYARKKSSRPEGEIVEVLERSKETFVGTVEISKKFAFLEPDSPNMPYDLFIPLENLNGATQGQKAVAKITDWPEKAKNPFGEIIEVLGDPGQNDTEMHAILAEFELPNKFPKEVEAEAEKLNEEITSEELKKRRDFRKVTTFTIDPFDAKDFDDALSLKKLENGNYEVGVHIADVSHYVKPDTILDKEAFLRGTSVYLVDRVVPMLPERLSNGVCSLRPNEEKLCFSAVFEMNEQAEIQNEWFGKTVIFSDRRFTYEEAQEIIEGKEGDFKEEILLLDKMAKKLRAERFAKGSIGFERDEVKFELDETGKPLGVYFKVMKDSNQMIEEFMLLANKQVAAFAGKKGENKKKPRTMVYRIHDKPDQEKYSSLAKFIKRFGYHLKFGSGKVISESLNSMLEEVKGKAEQNLIENLAVRTMAKAAYSANNIGHYGLNFSHYSHFTSPIRRYPDVMAHRILEHYLNGGKSVDEEQVENQCKYASERERKAVEAERASIKYKQVEFLKDRVGDIFEGIVSGVTEWGFFVEIIENKCEGLVHIRDLDDDYYIYDDEDYCIWGRHSGKRYQLGDKVRIKIVSANLVKKQLDFVLAEAE